MKILMLGWELPPHNSGGLGVACYQLCKNLSAKGTDIEFVLPYSAKHDEIDFMKVTAAHEQGVEEVIKSGIAYDSYKYLYKDGTTKRVGIFGQQESFENAVSRLVDARQYDVIHAHDWLTFRAALRAKEKLGCPLFLHVHSVERDRAGGEAGNPLVREIEYVSMMMADKVIAVSNHTKKCIVEDYGIPADKIEVVHNSIDIGSMEQRSEGNVYTYLEKMKSRGYKVVVNIGRLTIQKGLIHLLEATKAVVDHAPKTILLIVGSGEQYHELIEKAAELGISKNVVLTGFQRGERWRDAFAIGDLFVLPSVSEPFGLTPLEAIAYGTPALITKQSGVSEVIKNALKVDFWDVNEMANQMTAAVTSGALNEELYRNSLMEFESLSWESSAEKIIDLYGKHLQGVPA